jgi:putative tricarboxylic transport membrane protein
VMLLILNLPTVGPWIRLLEVPYRLLYPAILLLKRRGVVVGKTIWTTL